MPIQYTGIIEEHRAVRERAGIFDVSHMGRLDVSGPDAARLLRYVSTYDATRLSTGEGHYSLICNQEGGILDDIYIFRVEDERFVVVTNAANAEKGRDWISEHKQAGLDVKLKDIQTSTAMIAVQGPDATALVSSLSPAPLAEIKPRNCLDGVEVAGQRAFVSRTGYTGEDGFEIVTMAADGPAVWDALRNAGAQACGLGARDTLRLEAALLLYGNDIDASTNPFEAGLGWVVTFDDGGDFIGRRALLHAKERGPERSLVCLLTEDNGIPRAGCAILHDEKQIGTVSSGGFSPSLRRGIAMGYVPVGQRAEGTMLTVDVRGKPLPMKIVKRPFYSRKSA
jgi:aminomethyltransferase